MNLQEKLYNNEWTSIEKVLTKVSVIKDNQKEKIKIIPLKHSFMLIRRTFDNF